MEIKISTSFLLKVFTFFAWLVFIGLCIEAGGFISNVVIALFNPNSVAHFWSSIDFSALYHFNLSHFITMTTLISIVVVMKALMFYLIIKILHNDKLNLSQPFSKKFGSFIFNISFLTLGISLFSYWGTNFFAWIVSKGIQMPAIQKLQIGGADVWLFMSITLFVIAQIFKRGIELQEENELTI